MQGYNGKHEKYQRLPVVAIRDNTDVASVVFKEFCADLDARMAGLTAGTRLERAFRFGEDFVSVAGMLDCLWSDLYFAARNNPLTPADKKLHSWNLRFTESSLEVTWETKAG